MYVQGWGAENVAHSCPLWTGIPIPLVLGVEIGFAPRTYHVTYVRIGLWRSGKPLRRNALLLGAKDLLALQALRFPLRQRLLLVRGLLRKSRTLRLPLLPPSLQKGGVRGGEVSACPLYCFPWGFLSSRSACFEREGWKCLWTLFRCA